MKLYFVRHGETDMNARNMFYGWYDADINAKGISQAEELRDAFREIHIDKIYSSDLTRALHTAQIIADGRPVEIMPDLREMAYGIWENRTWESMTEADRELLKKWRFDWLDLEIPEGESFMGFYHRVTSGLDQIIQENKGKHVLVVSHNGALSAMHCHLTGAGPKGFWNFNSKQGHYSAVWISEKKLTYDCFNYPLCREKAENIYVDVATRPSESTAYGLHGDHPINLVWAGTKTEIQWEKKEQKNILKEHLDFIFLEEGDEGPDWFAVPTIRVFAKDGKGGWYARGEHRRAIYHISSEKNITYLAKDLRTYLQMVIFEQEHAELIKLAEEIKLERPKENLRRFVCPAHNIRLFADRAEAEKQLQLHDISEFMDFKPKKKLYYDCEKVMRKPEIDGYDVFPAGKKFDPFIMTCEENGFTSLQRKRGIYLIWEGNLPKLDLYPVPSMTFFAHDGDGGYFAHMGKDMDTPICFISKELECWTIAGSFREFVQMVVFEPNWKEKITGEKQEIFETEEELAAFGMLFGLSAPDWKLSENIRRNSFHQIYENVEKAREKMSIL